MKMNIPAIGTAGPDWANQLNENFSGFGNISYVIPGTEASADLEIAAAIAAIPAGGTVDARCYGATTQTWANHLDVGSATQPITLLLDRSTKFSVTVHDGSSAMTIWSNSAVWGEGRGNSGPSASPAGFNLASTASVASVINFAAASLEPIVGLHGLTVRGHATATVTNALVDVLNVTDETTISDMIIWDFTNTVGLLIRTGSNIALGPINFNNITVNGMGNTGARPVKITVSGTGVSACINFFGGSLTHPGSGGIPIVDIQNSTTGLINGVLFVGTQFESINSGDIGINCVNAAGVIGIGLVFTSSTTPGTSCVKVSNSGGGVTSGVMMLGIVNFGAWTNTVQDSVNSINYTRARIGHWEFLPPNTNTFVLTGANGEVLNIDDTKPTVTGSRGANAALASLLTALAGLGLLTDSSS